MSILLSKILCLFFAFLNLCKSLQLLSFMKHFLSKDSFKDPKRFLRPKKGGKITMYRINFCAWTRWGKRSEELNTKEEGLDRFVRATPLRWGKRSVPDRQPWAQIMEELSKRAPLRWGKRSPSRFGKRSPSRFGKRGPSRFGKREMTQENDFQLPWTSPLLEESDE